MAKLFYYKRVIFIALGLLFIIGKTYCQGGFDNSTRAVYIFDISKYNARLREVVKKLNAIADKDGIRILLPDKILFESGKSDLKSESEDALNAFLEIFNVYPEATVIFEGHTDNIGNAAVNLKLSVERAESVVNGLKAKKIPQSLKFETKGSGSTKPVANNSTEEGRTKNRRVEILIIP